MPGLSGSAQTGNHPVDFLTRELKCHGLMPVMHDLAHIQGKKSVKAMAGEHTPMPGATLKGTTLPCKRDGTANEKEGAFLEGQDMQVDLRKVKKKRNGLDAVELVERSKHDSTLLVTAL